MNKATKAAVLVLLAVTSLLPLGSCKKADEEPPQEIPFTLEIVDHMTNAGRSITKSGFADASMTVTAAETEISGVVAGYISVQDLSSGNILGSGNGSASFPTGNSTNYRVIRFHDGNGLKEVYDWLAAANIRLYAGRDSNFGRKDEPGCTGSEAVWSGAGGVFPQVNNVLQTPFKLGSVSTGGNQNWYGFWKSLGGDGGIDLSQRLIYVSPEHVPEEDVQTKVGMIELVEYLGTFNNVLDKPTSMTFLNPGSNVLNEKGEAGLRFIFSYCK